MTKMSCNILAIDNSILCQWQLWHALAKTLAEKTAWALAMDRGVDMVSINAGLLTGRDLSVTTPYLKGAPEMYEDGVLVTVDLNFLVDAHICVYESPLAFGRYLCFNHAICHPEDAVKFSQMISPSAPCLPPRYWPQRAFLQTICSLCSIHIVISILNLINITNIVLG